MIESASLWQLIEERAAATPHDRFAVDASDREISFGEYRDDALRAAHGLAARGIGTGDTVSWMLPTRIESMVLVAALARLGAIQNPILPIYRTREVRFIANQCKPTLLVTPPNWRGFDYPKMAEEIAAICLENPKVDLARVRVEKPGAGRFSRSVGIEIERVRE